MRFLIALLSIALFFSCQEVGKSKPTQGKNIYYYPTANVYYDADNNLYMVLNETAGWETKDELPQEQITTLGQKVVVENPSLPVWKDNGDHKMIYAANLYTTKDDYRQKFIEDSISSLPRKTNPVAKQQGDSTSMKKEKSGVGKFLNRLFRGKEKKDKKEKVSERDLR
jgi:hypothetical protein